MGQKGWPDWSILGLVLGLRNGELAFEFRLALVEVGDPPLAVQFLSGALYPKVRTFPGDLDLLLLGFPRRLVSSEGPRGLPPPSGAAPGGLRRMP